MENIQILKMTLNDFAEIKDKLLTDFDDFWSPSVLESELLGENKVYLVAKKENEIVGFAGVLLNLEEIEIMNIVTKKSERGNGIGTLLLNKIIEIAQNKSVREIILEVNENNKIARQMYTNSGFEEIGMRKNYYHSVENAILMSKKVKK